MSAPKQAYETAQALFAQAISQAITQDITQDIAQATTQATLHSSALTQNTRGNIRFYQLNHRYNRVDALALAYPTILALLGDDFFRAMALRYVDITPAQSANLSEDGATFSDFIAQFPPAAPYPYLADCARLDWVLHCAHFAENVAALDAQALVPYLSDAEQLGAIRLTFHPSLHLVSSSWAIQSIWQMHHGADTPTDWAKAESVLVWRQAALGEATRLIKPQDTAFLQSLQAGQSLGEALNMADDDFDLTDYLQFWLQEQLITGISN
ncbi:putative DNA-binding domain-containing protein [Chitinibacter bivalviorum]|uniref:Putative DNA-binding domain-containing protein n=1 Tax=Chitinibacter bivalviorum TaxID=2739434 RepID=A0A7H9BG13_9NEIS|nr:DNA-binding domain-containing protein [Chitinibacter bivalviorum]QLG87525.1 putative DNA-binding domain-containing protein [Chitinibacter bivalviorum]